MTDVLLVSPADSPGYVRLLLDEPVGTRQAGDTVVARAGDIEQTLNLHGQREFDVIDGSEVTFPDGTVWTAPAGK